MNISGVRQSLTIKREKTTVELSGVHSKSINDRMARLTDFLKEKQKRINKTIDKLKQEDIYHQVKTLMLTSNEDHYASYGFMGIYRLATLLTANTCYKWSVCLLDYGVVIFTDYNEVTVCVFLAEDKNGAYYPAEFNYNKHPMEFSAKKYIDNYYFKMYKEKYDL